MILEPLLGTLEHLSILMAGESQPKIEGGCGCGALRYRMENRPMFIHCCNCHHCQRETGSAFILNATIEADRLILIESSKSGLPGSITHPKLVLMPTESGKGQMIARCPHCGVAVWSYYADLGPYVKFVKLGTLDKESVTGQNIEDLMEPDVFIYAKFKQPWVLFPHNAESKGQIFDEFYNPMEQWPATTKERMVKLIASCQQWAEDGSKWDVLGEFVDCR